MLRAIVILWLIGDAVAHVLSFVLSWSSVEVIFTPQPGFSPVASGWLGSPDRIIALLWLIIVCSVMLLAIAGLLAAGLGVARMRAWWRQWAIVSALMSLVALLPWVALLVPPWLYTLVSLDVGIVLALALPWGDRLVQGVQPK